jgi:hypothetical protein
VGCCYAAGAFSFWSVLGIFFGVRSEVVFSLGSVPRVYFFGCFWGCYWVHPILIIRASYPMSTGVNAVGAWIYGGWNFKPAQQLRGLKFCESRAFPLVTNNSTNNEKNKSNSVRQLKYLRWGVTLMLPDTGVEPLLTDRMSFLSFRVFLCHFQANSGLRPWIRP